MMPPSPSLPPEAGSSSPPHLGFSALRSRFEALSARGNEGRGSKADLLTPSAASLDSRPRSQPLSNDTRPIDGPSTTQTRSVSNGLQSPSAAPATSEAEGSPFNDSSNVHESSSNQNQHYNHGHHHHHHNVIGSEISKAKESLEEAFLAIESHIHRGFSHHESDADDLSQVIEENSSKTTNGISKKGPPPPRPPKTALKDRDSSSATPLASPSLLAGENGPSSSQSMLQIDSRVPLPGTSAPKARRPPPQRPPQTLRNHRAGSDHPTTPDSGLFSPSDSGVPPPLPNRAASDRSTNQHIASATSPPSFFPPPLRSSAREVASRAVSSPVVTLPTAAQTDDHGPNTRTIISSSSAWDSPADQEYSSSAPASRASHSPVPPFDVASTPTKGFLPPPRLRSAATAAAAVSSKVGSHTNKIPLSRAQSIKATPAGDSSSSSSESEGDGPPSLPPSGLSSSAPSGSFFRGRLDRDGDTSGLVATLSETLPDASRANRRPPAFSPPRYAVSKHFSAFAVAGHTVCTASGDKVRVYRVGSTAHQVEGGDKLCSVAAEHVAKEVKILSSAFRPASSREREGRYLWCGTREGTLCEIDISEAKVTGVKHGLHTGPVVMLERIGSKMISLDDSGKICIWISGDGRSPLSVTQQPISQRVTFDKMTTTMLVGEQLWACSGTGAATSAASSSSRSGGGLGLVHLPSSASSAVASLGSSNAAYSKTGPKIRVYNPFAQDVPFNASSRPLTLGDYAKGIGAVTCGTIIPDQPDLVYLGHETGHVSTWSRRTLSCIGTQRLSTLAFTALCGVGFQLWTGNRSGRITIFVPGDGSEQKPWRVTKSWPAHDYPITAIVLDVLCLDPDYSDDGRPWLQVVSAAADHTVHIWDGLLSSDWLAHRVSRRSPEYSTYRQLRSLHLTFNIDAASPSDLNSTAEGSSWLPELFASACIEDGPPDLIYVGFQEVVDLEDKRLTAKSMLLNATGAMRSKGDKADMGEKVSHQYKLWHDRLVQSIRIAMPAETPYKVLHSGNMVGLFSCIFVRGDQYPSVTASSVTTVKTGLGGRWGNKGAIVSRLVIDDTSCCFVNAHLSAGQKHVKQRNDDLAQIFESEFQPTGPDVEDPGIYVSGGSGELILDHEVVFLSGDLNYRIDLPRSRVLSLLPPSNPNLTALSSADQLLTQLNSGSPLFRLRNFTEAGPLSFAPTYKYDRGKQTYDSSEKKRIPAWCDRILYRVTDVASDSDASASASDGDPSATDADWRDPSSPSATATATATFSHPLPPIVASQYTSHPSLLISDHRPVSCLFTFTVKSINRTQWLAVVGQEERKWDQERKKRIARAAAATANANAAAAAGAGNGPMPM